MVGKRLKEARLSLNLTQKEFGKLFGISNVAVSGYENNTKLPSMDTFIKMVEVLKLDANYMLGLENSLIKEDSSKYKVSSIDIEILKNLKTNKFVYNKLVDNPKRTIQIIELKLKG